MSPAAPTSPQRKFYNYAAIVLCAGCAAFGLVPPAASAADAGPTSRVHALVNFEFSDKYLTPRGMIVQDEGVVFQPLVLGFANVYADKDSFINSATIVGGIWNCFGSGRLASSDSGGTDKTSWYE